MTNDGDTVWNGKETDPENETDPEYVHETLQKVQAEAQKEEDSDEEDGNDEQDEDVMPIQDRDSMFAAEVRIPALRTQVALNKTCVLLWGTIPLALFYPKD